LLDCALPVAGVKVIGVVVITPMVLRCSSLASCARRRLYRRYLKWSADEHLCGKHAEKIVHQTAKTYSSQAGLFVPQQELGRVTEVLGHSIAPLTLDFIAHILNPITISCVATLLIEVKNIRSWVYPWDEELWQLLSYASNLAEHIPVVPIVVCAHAALPTFQMAKDVGFFLIVLRRQVFHTDTPEDEFKEVVDQFALVIERYAGPTDDHVANFLTTILRRSPPPTPPFNENIPWFQQQAQRFTHLAPTIRRFSTLAHHLPDDSRPKVWDAARGALKATINWPQVASW